jgi:hypothetical protein
LLIWSEIQSFLQNLVLHLQQIRLPLCGFLEWGRQCKILPQEFPEAGESRAQGEGYWQWFEEALSKN